MRRIVEDLNFLTHVDSKQHFVRSRIYLGLNAHNYWNFVISLLHLRKFSNLENCAFSSQDIRTTVRDFDLNPCALESWGLGLSNAQEFECISCKPCPLKRKFEPIITPRIIPRKCCLRNGSKILIFSKSCYFS